jgi:hypothetical protein
MTLSTRTEPKSGNPSFREIWMPPADLGGDLSRSALIIVDMQNDFLHADGSFAHIAREHPDAKIDLPFLTGTIPRAERLAA